MDSSRTFSQRHSCNDFMSGAVDDAQITGPFVGDVDAVVGVSRRRIARGGNGENGNQTEDEDIALDHDKPALKPWPILGHEPGAAVGPYFIGSARRQNFVSSRFHV